MLTYFIGFDGAGKNLIAKIIHDLEQTAIGEECFGETQQLLARIETYLETLADKQDMVLRYEKLSLPSPLQAVAIQIVIDYNNLAERLYAYMDLVTRFEGEKLFILVNLRSFVTDKESGRFLDTIAAQGFKVLLLDGCERPILPREKRLLIDQDLCEL